jgi:hypothetical protein
MTVNLFYIRNEYKGKANTNALAALSTPDLWRGRRNHAPHIYRRTDHSSCTLRGALHGHLNGHRLRSIRYKESSQGNDILCRLALHLWRNIIGVGSATWMKPCHVVDEVRLDFFSGERGVPGSCWRSVRAQASISSFLASKSIAKLHHNKNPLACWWLPFMRLVAPRWVLWRCISTRTSWSLRRSQIHQFIPLAFQPPLAPFSAAIALCLNGVRKQVFRITGMNWIIHIPLLRKPNLPALFYIFVKQLWLPTLPSWLIFTLLKPQLISRISYHYLILVYQ